MSVFVALRTLLLADVDVAAVTTTIAPKVPQEPTFPLITIRKISGPQDAVLDYAHPRFQVTAWADDYEDGENLAQLIKYTLQRYKGTVAGMEIKMIVFMNDTYINDPDTGRETFPVDFRVDYLEA